MDFKSWLESKDEFKEVLSQKGCFKVDNPFINKAGQTPEGLAQIIVLVLSTIRTPFERVAVVYSRLMSILNTVYSHKPIQMYPGKDGKPAYNAQEDLDDLISHETMELNIPKKFATKSILFGWKWKGISEVWNSRHELKARLDAIASSLVKEKTFEDIDHNEQVYNKMIKFLSENVTGLQIAKAAFVVQLVYGRKACLDINNIDIWTNIAKAASFHELEKNLEPIAYKKRKAPGDLFANDPLQGAPTKWKWDERKPFDERMGVYDEILKGMYQLAGVNPKNPKEGPAMAWDVWSDFLAGLSKARGTSIYKDSGAAAAQKIYDKLPKIDIPKVQGGVQFGLPIGPHRGGQAVSHQHLFAGLPFGSDVPKALDQSRTLAKKIVKPSELGDVGPQQMSLRGVGSQDPISHPQSVMNIATEPSMYDRWLAGRVKKKGKTGFAHKIQFKDWFIQENNLHGKYKDQMTKEELQAANNLIEKGKGSWTTDNSKGTSFFRPLKFHVHLPDDETTDEE